MCYTHKAAEKERSFRSKNIHFEKSTSASTQLKFKSKATEGEKAVSEVVGNFLK